jgi:hypothetical protein
MHLIHDIFGLLHFVGKVSVFFAPTNNKVVKIACFQFWGGLMNN